MEDLKKSSEMKKYYGWLQNLFQILEDQGQYLVAKCLVKVDYLVL